MTRERLEELKEMNKHGRFQQAQLTEVFKALDELLPPPPLKVGDVVTDASDDSLLIGRIDHAADGRVEIGGSTFRSSRFRRATPEERAVFEAWEKGQKS